MYRDAVSDDNIEFNDSGGNCRSSSCKSKFELSSCSGQSPSSSTSGRTADLSFSGSVVTFSGSTSDACCDYFTCVGNYIDTEAVFLAKDSAINYEYKAQDGGDWYEAAIVLYEAGAAGDHGYITSGVEKRVVRGDKINSFITGSFEADDDGFYYLGFFVASYDRTNGGGLGARMQINGFSASATSLEDACVD